MTKSAVITFAEGQEVDRAVHATFGDTVLHAAIEGGIPLLHDCGGHARCTTCRVRVLDGLENLSAPTAEEAEIAQTYSWPRDVRLACQAEVRGDTLARAPGVQRSPQRRRQRRSAALQGPDPIFIAHSHLPAINAAGGEFVHSFYRHFFRIAQPLRELFGHTEMSPVRPLP